MVLCRMEDMRGVVKVWILGMGVIRSDGGKCEEHGHVSHLRIVGGLGDGDGIQAAESSGRRTCREGVRPRGRGLCGGATRHAAPFIFSWPVCSGSTVAAGSCTAPCLFGEKRCRCMDKVWATLTPCDPRPDVASVRQEVNEDGGVKMGRDLVICSKDVGGYGCVCVEC